jgi:hypothetical protein
MIGGSCDPNNSYTGRSDLLVQRCPQARQSALILLKPQGIGLEGKLPALNAALTRHHDESLQLTEVHPLEKRLVEVNTVLLQGLNQLAKQRSALLIPHLQDIPEGIHDGVDAAQAVKVSLSVSTVALGHQLLIGAGKGGREGGDDPTLIGI